jgi:uncharacterized phage infection (PIP) family protein YhgE
MEGKLQQRRVQQMRAAREQLTKQCNDTQQQLTDYLQHTAAEYLQTHTTITTTIHTDPKKAIADITQSINKMKEKVATINSRVSDLQNARADKEQAIAKLHRDEQGIKTK